MVDGIIYNILYPVKRMEKIGWTCEAEPHSHVAADVDYKAFFLKFRHIPVMDENGGSIRILQDSVYNDIHSGQLVYDRF